MNSFEIGLAVIAVALACAAAAALLALRRVTAAAHAQRAMRRGALDVAGAAAI